MFITWSRAWSSARWASVRSPVHFTGRPSLRDAHSTSAISGKTVERSPNEPPMSGLTTRKCDSGTPSTSRAIHSRIAWTFCDPVWSV